MNEKELRQFEMLSRVSAFATENAADFPAATLAGRLIQEIKTAVERLEQLAGAKESGAATHRTGTAQKAAAREELRDDLQVIARTARAMALDMTGLEQKFRLPRSNSDQQLTAAARAFLADAPPLTANFIEYGLPDDFLEDLENDLETFEAAFDPQNAGRSQSVGANAEIDRSIQTARLAARRLDAIVRNKYRNNAGKLAAWTSASHIAKAPARNAQSPPVNQPAI